ncbi:phosphoribosylanthranilate isomerase [Tuwongella immobilis]|uniref:N-(5'-phosphoribosyl)anthranilate isomerase n=1 Tax=Tuwongella immobilis TaxID=692036 RepID=A0A6C2YPP8_9BACT|nr:phosphoribosylanthranilate isomerase [Tuwongella immobilis]VIP03608.1 n-(5 -phosphoribosyl)anthranilate isomerase : N-(5'-phosphoribosyl)anthranilate isomerase OS=Geobacter sp. (strain M21) GN=trpF PE=3 SV=1: PRAI [Tuwongella immobilis]VTS04584.1 n-(5 -phosphoribosyl)anthranilate isomerase : N-(5'-phosphoribosyl)anthranilate isomerase OS=Geobacter sp. (strain M21) GN=trpF PE=3 SV=1: PRAI [Tuwongella immobilis]
MVRVKICGVTTIADLEMLADEGCDAVGINFYPKSPRYIAPRDALTLVQACSPMMSLIGLFVAQPLRQVFATAYQLGIRGVQCYGEPADWEPPAPFALLPAFRVKTREDLLAIDAAVENATSRGITLSGVLVDSMVDGQLGGTGHVAPWELLAEWKPKVPLVLAGGLKPENIAEAIRIVRPAAVDVASGVESAPGKKERQKVRDLIQAVRQVSATGMDSVG